MWYVFVFFISFQSGCLDIDNYCLKGESVFKLIYLYTIRCTPVEQNLMAAIELDEQIGYSASSLAGQPYKGRNGRVEGTRELVIHPPFCSGL